MQQLGVFAVRENSVSILQPIFSCETSVRLCELALVCQRGVSQLRNILPNGASAAKRRVSRRGKNHSQFAATKRWYPAAKWHSCVKKGFRSCENFRSGCKVAAKWFHSGDRFSKREVGFSQQHLRAAKFFRSGMQFSQRPSFAYEIFVAKAFSLLLSLF